MVMKFVFNISTWFN